MDQSAIEQIQNSTAALANEAQSSLNACKTGGVPYTLVPQGFKVQELNIEKYEPFRRRFSGQMQTKSLDDFCEYSLKNATEGTACFINAEAMAAKTIINYGDRDWAGHCDDTARVSLQKTAEYQALQILTARKMEQKTLAEFIEEWADHITCLDENSNAIENKKAINSIRKITIEANASSESQTQSFRESRSTLESIEAKNDDCRPHFIVFNCQPYRDIAARDFVCRLSIITSEQKPLLNLRIIREETHQEEISEEFKDLIDQKFKEKIQTYLANFEI